MEVRNCKKCGKIFQYDGVNKTCRECRNAEADDFKKVREYLYKNPGATVQIVSGETEVSTKKIFRYLREGRIELTDKHGNGILECEKCGGHIKSGRYCERCKAELTKELKGAVKKEGSISNNRETKNNDKMYTANRNN